MVGAVVLATGAVVYGLLATAYDKFYAELGLTPADVGTQYGKTLGGATALTILVCMSMALLTFGFDRILGSRRVRNIRRERRQIVIVLWAAATVVLFAGAFALAGLLAAIVLLGAAFVCLGGLIGKDSGDCPGRDRPVGRCGCRGGWYQLADSLRFAGLLRQSAG